MSIEQLAAHGDEQTSTLRLARIVRHIGYDRIQVSRRIALRDRTDVADPNGLFFHSDSLNASLLIRRP